MQLETSVLADLPGPDRHDLDRPQARSVDASGREDPAHPRNVDVEPASRKGRWFHNGSAEVRETLCHVTEIRIRLKDPSEQLTCTR